MTYPQVAEALKNGADPNMLCMTCPWDRHCLTPPIMTSAEVEAEIEKAKQEDERRMREAAVSGTDPGLPMGSLVTIMAVGGRDTLAKLCPVLALRLRMPEGERSRSSCRA
jgi:hypothetical protein